MAFDAAGDLFLAGAFGGTMSFDGGVVVQAAAPGDAFLAKVLRP